MLSIKIIFRYTYIAIKKSARIIRQSTSWIITIIKFKLNGVKITTLNGNGYIINGIPIMQVGLKATVSIGHSFTMNNGLYDNIIGRQQPCFFVVRNGAELLIGNNVGISATAIICSKRIEIQDNVKIGGGTVIYDTDFHSLNTHERNSVPEVFNNVQTKPVIIKSNSFIGANCTILKGVIIGRNSIIGACSVVTKNVPDNEIWAGNPARFIRKIL